MAASKVGAVAVPLNYRLAPAELAYIIGDSGTRVLLVLAGMEATLAALRPNCRPAWPLSQPTSPTACTGMNG